MPISALVTKSETGMSVPKFLMRATHLGVQGWSALKIEPSSWSVQVAGSDDAVRLDAAGSHVILNLPRKAVETLLDYADASSNDDFCDAIAALLKAYTGKS